ncbi:hypothetical protein [Nonomuraea sp. SYSU D8015]|uniref:hypothetical protein n=1 Tax=Nonomuraea sp. SYSU D8015 TaxID=2593644 RepID=UPI0016606BCD|nr:hypothetical protein [Nonomuraea sp. SYSU D8015]
MDFWGTVLVLIRRWYVVVPAFLLAVGGAFVAYSTIPTTYTTSAVLVLTTPTSGGVKPGDPKAPISRVNPLLNFDHGLSVAASMLINAMSTPDMVAEMGVEVDGDPAYAVTNGTNNLESLATGPLVFVEGESTRPEAATAIALKVIDRIEQELDLRQRQVQAPAETYITIREAVPPSKPMPQRGGKSRAAAAALGLGTIGALCAAFVADNLAGPLRAYRARRAERGRPRDAEPMPEELATVEQGS